MLRDMVIGRGCNSRQVHLGVIMKAIIFVLLIPVIAALAGTFAIGLSFLMGYLFRSDDYGYIPITATTVWCGLTSLGLYFAWKLIGL